MQLGFWVMLAGGIAALTLAFDAASYCEWRRCYALSAIFGVLTGLALAGLIPATA